ncbi:MAG: sensor histidine kinase [Bdellovibrionota bacterium]
MAFGSEKIQSSPTPLKEQWHLLYYVLAAFDLITILGSFFLCHTLLSIHNHTVDINQVWVERFDNYERVAQTMGKVIAPGNDVFDNSDVNVERERLKAGLWEFRAAMAQLKKKNEGLLPEEWQEFQRHFSYIDRAMDRAASDINSIFANFEAGNSARAASRMAATNRDFARVRYSMARMRKRANDFQKEALINQRDKARGLGQFEFILGGFVLLVIVLITLYGHEMSNRMRATHRLIEEQRMAMHASAKLSALGEMAGGIAHEINNPLAIIQMWALHLREMQKKGAIKPELLTEACEVTERTTYRIAAIIRGLRTFARDARGDPFVQEPLAKTIGETLGICRERFQHRGIRLEVAEPDSKLLIDCRSTEISQVLLNLLNNAVDAVADLPNPWVRIEATEIEDSVEVSVTDSGRGISREIADKLMQPFFTTKEVGRGTGLGLSISKGIIESHHGKLWYDSSSKNTRFVFSLPKSQKATGTKTQPTHIRIA